MSITLLELQERVARELNGYIEGTVSGAGDSGGLMLVDTALEYPDESLSGKYVKITDSSTTAIEGQVRRIRHFQSPTGTVNVQRAFSAQVPTSTTYAIYDYNPVSITYWINEAVRRCYPYMQDIVVDRTLITNNILPNASFEDGTTAPTHWTVDTATYARSSTYYKNGSYSASLTTAAGMLYISSDSSPDLLRMNGASIRLSCWVKCSVASTARIQILYTGLA